MRLPDRLLTKAITHRGLHDVTDGRPENSVEAIDAAIARGYGIEIDLQLSKDGVAMVFHDYHLGRLTGETGPVAQRTADELASIALTGGKAGIPTFAEVLARVAGVVPLLIEIKDQDGEMGGWAPLPASVCDHLRDIPDYDRTGASFISHEGPDLARPRVAALKARGAHVLCWTIKSATQEAEARKIADNVTFEGYLA